MQHSLAATLLTSLLAGSAVAQGLSCEQLRADIESRVRAKGVASAVVAVVDEQAVAPGQRVGSCDGGRKKLVMTREGAAAAATAAAPSTPSTPSTATAQPAAAQPARPRARPPVITECADGRVITEGSCKR